MKSHFPLLLATSLILASHTTSAAVLAQWSYSEVPAGYVGTVEPFDYADGATVSDFDGHGSATIIEQFCYRGWSTTVDTNNYCGFTISPEAGKQLTVTHLDFSSVNSNGITGFQWGYRVDNGGGFGTWQLGNLYEPGETGFDFVSSSQNAKVWDIPDFTTTGTVEFGLFAQGLSTTSTLIVSQPRALVLNGSVTAVPEPSAALISAAGALVALRRRRR